MRKRITLLSILLIVLIVGMWLLKEQDFLRQPTGGMVFRDTTHLLLTNHAICRMDCRHINREEIKEIIMEGTVNYSKSGLSKKGDDTYALEGYSKEDQHIRVVVAPEEDGLVVVTCIDLDHDWPCNCD